MTLASPAVKLFNEYCKHSYKDHSWQSRMKVAPFPSLFSVLLIPPPLPPFLGR
jgi:hypothetical protein